MPHASDSQYPADAWSWWACHAHRALVAECLVWPEEPQPRNILADWLGDRGVASDPLRGPGWWLMAEDVWAGARVYWEVGGGLPFRAGEHPAIPCGRCLSLGVWVRPAVTRRADPGAAARWVCDRCRRVPFGPVNPDNPGVTRVG